MIAAATGRYKALNRVQHRLRDLWDHGYLKRHHPFYNRTGGSSKPVYLLDVSGAQTLSRHYGKTIRPLKNFKVGEHHPMLWHNLGTNYLRVLIEASCRQDPDKELLYDYPDDFFHVGFKDNKNKNYSIKPDFFFGIKFNDGTVNNFFLEYQRPTNQTRKKIRRKLLNYLMFWKYQVYKSTAVTNDYPDVENWPSFRVLIVTDPETSQQEHGGFIQTARSIDDQGKGLGLFWFARADKFSLNNPGGFYNAVWRKPTPGNSLKNAL